MSVSVSYLKAWLVRPYSMAKMHCSYRAHSLSKEQYPVRLPLLRFEDAIWELRRDFWTWGYKLLHPPEDAASFFAEAIKMRWEHKRLYARTIPSALKSYYHERCARLKNILRPKNLRKRFVRFAKQMPVVCIGTEQGITAVVLRKDLNAAKLVFSCGSDNIVNVHDYCEGRERLSLVARHGVYGTSFVPKRTMIFAKPTNSTLKRLGIVPTGTREDMKALLDGSVQQTGGGFFVPFAWRGNQDWQRKQFSPPPTLEEAYALVWGKRRRAPSQQTVTQERS